MVLSAVAAAELELEELLEELEELEDVEAAPR